MGTALLLWMVAIFVPSTVTFLPVVRILTLLLVSDDTWRSVLHGLVHTQGRCVRAHRSLKRPRDLGLAGHVIVVRPWRKASMPVSPAGFGPLHGLSMVYLWSIYGLSYGLSMVYLRFSHVSGISRVFKEKNAFPFFSRPKTKNVGKPEIDHR